MGDSDYIFDQQQSLFYISQFIGLCMIALGVCIFFKYLPKWAHNKTSEKLLQVLVPCLPIAVAVSLFVLMPKQREKYSRIKKYESICVGVTLGSVSHGRGERGIKYKFSINNKLYYGESGYVYNGETIQGIKEINGHYKVIFNRNNPGESVMDFKAPEENQ